jgi:sec-independent protein translocase protein TatB
MFDVGFAELFLLALIGLLVLGPERLPGVARTVGGFVRKARMSWNSLRSTIETELAEADISSPLKQAGDELKQIGKNLSDLPDFHPQKSKTNTIEADATADSAQQDVPEQNSDTGKSENV